MQQIM